MVPNPGSIRGRLRTIGVLWAILAGLSVTSELIAAEAGKATCDYSLYLQEVQPRAKYVAMRRQLHEFTKRMAGPDLRYQFESPAPTNHPKRYIDEVSTRCLGCHDENGAVKKYGATSVFDNTGMSRMTQAHPVGLLYERRTLANATLHSSADFPEEMVLVYGRLSCITCHDPLNADGNHLAEKNRGTLCFSCHNM